MKRAVAVAATALMAAALAQGATTIRFEPKAGTKTRYRYTITTSAKVGQLQVRGSQGTAAQQSQLRSQLESATQATVTLDQTDTVQRVEADGTRRVRSSTLMTIKSGALPAGSSAPTVGLSALSLYRPSGAVQVSEVKLDKSRTPKAIAAAFEASTKSLENLFSQANNFGFYGKALTQGRPVEVRSEVAAPANAPGTENLKYKLRSRFTLLGRTAGGGYRIETEVAYEPISIKTTSQGTPLEVSIRSDPSRGEVTLLPDGRLERYRQPIAMSLTSKIGTAAEGLDLAMTVSVNVAGQIAR